MPATLSTDPGGRRDYIDFFATRAAQWGADQARALLDQHPEPESAADCLVARPLMEKVAAMGDRIGQHTVGEIITISGQALAWLAANPTPQPEPSGYIDPEHKGEDLALLETFYRACNAEGGTADEIQLRGIRAVLATHSTPQPPADGEVAELVEWVGKDRQWLDLRRDVKDRILRIADLLERQRPQPVAVSERLPGASDCDEQGRCWWGFEGTDDYEPCWTLRKMHGIPFSSTRFIPANALPTPENTHD